METRIEKTIAIVRDMLNRFDNEGVVIYCNERQAVEKLIEAAEDLDVLMSSVKHYTFKEIRRMGNNE